MATPTYDSIASQTLVSTASSITFSSIPQTYRDLVLVVSAKTDVNNVSGGLRLNGDSGSNYTGLVIEGTGSSTSDTTSGGTFINPSFDVSPFSASAFAFVQFNIMNYSETDKQTMVLTRVSRASSGTGFAAHRYANTSAITSLTYFPGSGNWAAGSTFSLFGIEA